MDAGQLSYKLNLEKTELLWSGSSHSLCKLGDCGPTINLGTDIIKARGHVRLLGVIMSSDLNLEKHVSVFSAACFFDLRQIRRVRQSLDVESAATLVHAFAPYWPGRRRQGRRSWGGRGARAPQIFC